MNYENFQTNYRMNRETALLIARMCGVSMAQVQLWVIRFFKEGN